MNQLKKRPRIAITPGEPAGIGPDLCVQLSQQQLECELVFIANPQLLERRAKELNIPINIVEFNANEAVKTTAPGVCFIVPIEMKDQAKAGQLERSNSSYVLKTISRATRGCIDGVFDAMVTGSVHKGVLNDAGYKFTGHTEYIADITGGYPVMMLATPGLRVALVTTHIPLSQVSQAITHSKLRKVIRILHEELYHKFGIKNPRILVCGLNPHAGEGGHLGNEEIDIIEPVLNGLRKQGLNLIGPLPADTIFTPKYLDNADAVLAMYHDQGLPVLKHLGFGHAANITLGLPIIRTSVDHGTALDLAGTGKAESGSLVYAIETALKMINQRK